MSTNTVIPGGLSCLSGFFFTSQEKHLPIPPILLTAEIVWTHVETTGLIYCLVLALVTKHRDWLSGNPGQPQVHDLHIFLSLSVSWPSFLLPLYILFSAPGYFSPLVMVLLHSYPNLVFYGVMLPVRGISSCTLTSHHCQHHLDH